MDQASAIGIILGLVSIVTVLMGVGAWVERTRNLRREIVEGDGAVTRGFMAADTTLATQILSVSKDIGAVDHKVRNIQEWRELLPGVLEAKFVQHVELKAITDSLERIEDRQGQLVQRLLGPGK